MGTSELNAFVLTDKIGFFKETDWPLSSGELHLFLKLLLMWKGANLVLPVLASFSCWTNVSMQLCICRKLIAFYKYSFLQIAVLQRMYYRTYYKVCQGQTTFLNYSFLFSCSSSYSFYSLQAAYHNSPTGFWVFLIILKSRV